MPAGAVKSLAKKHGISVKSAEKKWSESKKAAGKSYDKDSSAFWGTTMKIFKNKMKKHGKKESRIYDFETFVNEKYIN